MDCDPTALPTQAILDAIESLQKKVDSVCKRPRSDEEQPRDVAFKHEGNRQQYLFTGVIDKHIGHALAALEELDVPAVLGHLTQARTAIATRQKHIRLADRSALGWATVSEYVEDELADDSGDEKRIKKAEKAAAAKEAEASKKAASKRQGTSRFSRPQQDHQSRPFRGGHFRSSYSYAPYRRPESRLCFQCGVPGHVRSNCPSLRPMRRPAPGAPATAPSPF